LRRPSGFEFQPSGHAGVIGTSVPVHTPERLPHLGGDPDARARRGIWLIWTGLALVLVLAWVVGPIRASRDAVPWLVKAPLIALVLMWPLWQGARLLRHAMRAAPLATWHGRYYEFDNVQIRVLVDEDDRLLIVASDVLDALSIQGRGRDVERIRAVAGRDGLRTVPGMREPVFTENGLQAWLERNSRRDVARFALWLRTQVSEPHRRMLERGTRN
jgi:hypothetical protein